MIKDKSKQYFVRVPLTLLYDDRITKSALLLYAVLMDTADQYGMQIVDIDTLAARCRCSGKTVRRAEAQLCAAGYISVYRTGRASLIQLTDTELIRSSSGIQAYRATSKAKEA